MRFFIHLAYKGTNYHGWQIQPNAPTIQEILQTKMSLLFKEEIKLTGCGRTDAGVHARNFYAHFDATLKNNDLDSRIYQLNSILPNDIKVLGLHKMHKEAHARFDAVSRTYKYYISLEKEIFLTDYTWKHSFTPNLELLNNASQKLFNYTDFTSFSKLHTDVKTNNCKIIDVYWERKNDLLIFTIEADRFLRNMVRAVVGTLIDVGKQKLSINGFCEVIEKKERASAGFSVPAAGLFLEKIKYPYRINE